MKGRDPGIISAKQTIAKIRAKQNAGQKPVSEAIYSKNQAGAPSSTENALRQRVSKTTTAIGTQERKSAMNAIIKKLLLGEITQGDALKKLRIEVLGLKQDTFAQLVSVSRKTLSEVENDKGNYTSDVINKLFKPFGLQVGLVPISRHMFSALFVE